MADKPGSRVAAGGMWSTPKAEYSKGTQELLKVMMKESKLTNFQQRQLDRTMSAGGTLPTNCNPTTSAKPRLPKGPPTKQNNSKVIDPRKYNPKVKTKDDIEASGAYSRDKYTPAPQTKFGGYYEKDKARLANMMAYGEDEAPPKARQRPVTPEPQPQVDRFEELQKEIVERQAFLEQMECLGKGPQYRTVIATEISQLLREMELIDKKRSAELQKWIEAEEQKKNKKS